VMGISKRCNNCNSDNIEVSVCNYIKNNKGIVKKWTTLCLTCGLKQNYEKVSEPTLNHVEV